jgi:S1-C subfamily serine protease
VPAAVKKDIFPDIIRSTINIQHEMNSEIELESIIEDYLKGKLTPAELEAFELLRKNDPAVDHKVVAHKVFLESLQQYADVLALKEQMDQAHAGLDVAALSDQFKPHPSLVINLWRKNKSLIAVAASFILLATLSIYSIQHNTKQNGSYEEMRMAVADIKNSQNRLIRNINSSKAHKENINPGRFGGTGFALSSNGYLCTNFHVINGADSIYVQNNKGQSFKVKVVFSDPQYDLAILKIDDESFSSLPNIPYRLKKDNIGMGEDVYTLGFPKDGSVLGKGYVSSNTGYNGDTTAYQVSIPVNPGNSGGPLLDYNGNIIGAITAKENQTDGATFAIKSQYIVEALNAIPQDSIGTRIVSGSKKNALKGLDRAKQIEKTQDYVFMIKVYN